MIDKGLLSKVKQVYATSQPVIVQLSDVLAVIDKESGGVPTFHGPEPLFRMNLNMANINSGVPINDIRNAIVIKDGAMRGMWCKFRMEPGYWAHFSQPLAKFHPHQWTPGQLVLMASSVGLGQQMLRFVIEKLPADKMLDRAYEFMGSVTQQIQWVIGNLQGNACRDTTGDRQLMFARYNLGGALPKGHTYNTYGADVLQRAKRIDNWLRENDHGQS